MESDSQYDDSIRAMNSERQPLFNREYQPGVATSHGDICDNSPCGSENELKATEVQLYKRRWYLLVLFAMLCFMQGGVWNTWGPLASSTYLVFGWGEEEIGLLSNWGPITYIISTPFFAWLMDVKGLRWAALITGVLVAVGTGLRCITSTDPAATWLMHIGQILNGFGGPVGMGAAPLMSALWFPAYQRTTATAFITVMNNLGIAVSFIIDIANIKSDIMRLMYIEFGAGALILLLILVYFPNKPPKSPSITASIERVDFKDGVKKLFRHKHFWVLAAPYAISGGVYSCWSSVLDTNLKPVGVSEVKAGWLGFYSSIAGTIAGLVLATFADIFKKRMKLYMIVLYSLAFTATGVFTLACQGYIPLLDSILYPSIILGAMCISGASPIFFELCCESTYPIAEGVTNSLLTWLNNVAGFIFLLLTMVPSIGTAWMNWCLTASIFICLPILFIVKERYTRLDIDISARTGASSSIQK